MSHISVDLSDRPLPTEHRNGTNVTHIERLLNSLNDVTSTINEMASLLAGAETAYRSVLNRWQFLEEEFCIVLSGQERSTASDYLVDIRLTTRTDISTRELPVRELPSFSFKPLESPVSNLYTRCEVFNRHYIELAREARHETETIRRLNHNLSSLKTTYSNLLTQVKNINH